MEPFSQLLLDVWREACVHIEIGESVALGAPILFRRLPVDLVLVRRLEVERQVVETVAAGLCRPGPVPQETRSECTAGQFEDLLAWCRRNKVEQCKLPEDRSALLPGLVPTDLEGEVLIGPLNAADGPTGLVVFVARAPHHFRDRHLAMLRLLLEPFTIWLENDRRLRELRVQREAAEAEKQSLLNRLGRTDLNDTIVGADSGLRAVIERVDLVTRTDVPVLILGETGSGKEVVARTIHNRSKRAGGPFLRVNCGAIAPDLVDSELFGHERGSFTGATGQRKGWFERSDGGTLFLDECGELPPAVQVRLLRVLQDGTFERVGGEQQMHVDVRVVAATHRNLEAMVSDGRFREDLWYRLAVFPIHLPALRERPADIPDLAAHFAFKSARRLGLPACLPTPEDIGLLVSYAWPGNVRELGAVIERAAILGEGRRLEIAKALGLIPQAAEPRILPIAIPAPPRPGVAKFATLDEAMSEHIVAALEKTGGRIEGPEGAAQLLDINPHTLRARMRKMGIEWNRFRVAKRG
jgi:transcriptional regulator with GAF, ATPase, and Fis domain